VSTFLRDLRKSLLVRLLESLSGRRQRIVAWELLSRIGVNSVTFTRGELIWNVQLPYYDHIEWELFVDGGFQVAEMEAVLAWARHFGDFSGSRNVLIDAGANCGTTCIPIVHATGCRALAIEPVAATFAQLRRNVESNSLGDKILLAKKAVAIQPGRLRMSVADTSGKSAVAPDRTEAGEAPLHGARITGYEEVEADTLSGIVAAAGLDAGEIAMVWSDVQGCELAVIESGSEFWARGTPLWAEVEPISLRRQGMLDGFADTVAAHFDRFIPSAELRRLGVAAVPHPIAEFPELVAALTPGEGSTDVLLLPPGFTAGSQ
jgi:FkbM family methyltransferase